MLVTLRTARGLGLPVQVEPGTSAGDVARRAAVLTGDPGWLTARLWVDDVPVAAGHPAGVTPLRTGAALAHDPGPPDPVASAAGGARHLAVLAGPSAGEVLALGRGVRAAGRRWWDVPVGGRGVALVTGPVRVSRVWWTDRDGHRRRTCPGPPVLLALVRAGDRVRTADATVEVRTAVPRLPHAAPGRRVALVATLVGPVALAVVTGHWWYLALAAAAPLTLLSSAGRGAVTAGAGQVGVRDLAALRIAAVRYRWTGSAAVHDDLPWSADGALAVTGPGAVELAAGVALLALGAPPCGPLHLLGTTPPWTRWLEARPGLPDRTGPAVVLAGPDADPAAVAAWRASADPGVRLVVATTAGPAWCAHVLRTGEGPVRLATPDGREVTLDLAVPGGALVERVARELAGLAVDTDEAVPTQVSLGDLPGIPAPDPEAVAAAWDTAAHAPPLPVGRGAGGRPYLLDLVGRGPHALVGGTTGSGKSELLVTTVLAAALGTAPHRLAVLLVDFKGGTGLGALAGLPHVVGHVCDLDRAAAARTLAGLGAELRRREQVLAAAGAADLVELDPDDPATPPRLLVVVDELRSMLDDVPDAGAVLTRLAALGRSLGVHLVLATQRPGGAITPDLRANLPVRIALRVCDTTDAVDLLGDAAAAHLDGSTPGRALVGSGPGPAVPVQVARARRTRSSPTGPGWSPTPPPAGDDVAAWVSAAQAAARGRRRPAVPWLPDLPLRVDARDVPPGPGLAVALADRPDRMQRAAVRWSPAGGPLLVLGGAGSGRSTALATVGLQALAAGHEVHAIGLPPGLSDRLRAAGTRFGTAVGTDDVVTVGRLLELLEQRADRPVLLVDDVAGALDRLGRLARGQGADRLTRLWTAPDAAGQGPALVVAAGPGAAATRLLPAFAQVVVLELRDRGTEAMLGVPSGLAGRGVPGRGVHLHPDGPVRCQVALPAAPPADGSLRPGPVDRCGDGPPPVVGPVMQGDGPAVQGAGPATPGGPPALRLRPLPLLVPDHPPHVLGLGGDVAGVVQVPVGGPFLVVGPPGSGRSTALARVAAGYAAAGHRVVHGLTPDHAPACDDPVVQVLDDVEQDLNDPAFAARLTAALAAPGAAVLAAADLDTVAAAFRGPLAALVRARRLLVLDPGAAGAIELLGPAGRWLADPAVRVPGRGVLRLDHTLIPVQVAAPAPSGPR